jgi:rhodanese-related sulfurtransferase
VFDGTARDADPSLEISTNELLEALKDPRVEDDDARAPAEYAVSHIPGARNVPGKPGLPASLYTADVSQIGPIVPDKTRKLILYCNGIFCGRSKRLAADLRQAGYKDVRRYQLGIPAWRALGGVTQVERDALIALLASDRTAVLVDARPNADARRRLPNARVIPFAETSKAKDDGRLPMTDHATRIFVVGDDGAEARRVAEAIVRDAFHNVSFFDGSAADLSEVAGDDDT